LAAERRLVELVVALSGKGLLASAHDVSDGGLAVALGECAMQGGVGAEVALDSEIRGSSLLFGESTGRALVSFAPSDEAAVRAAAEKAGVPFAVVGTVGGGRLKMWAGSRALVDEDLAALDSLWRGAVVHVIESAQVL